MSCLLMFDKPRMWPEGNQTDCELNRPDHSLVFALVGWKTVESEVWADLATTVMDPLDDMLRKVEIVRLCEDSEGTRSRVVQIFGLRARKDSQTNV